MKVLKVLAALASFAACSVQAAGAVEVRQVAEIKASPAAVWAKVGEWCAIKDWHPAIASCQPGKKGFRTLTLKDGAKILEKITKTGKNTYSYDIIESPLPVKNYKATLTAKADSLGSTDLTWTAKFDAAKGKTDAEAAAVINGIFEAGLNNVKSTLKFDAPAATAAAAGAPAAATAAGAVAGKTVSAAAARDEARLKAREERQKRLEAAKLVALEKYAKAKAVVAEKAKAAAEAAKAAFEKAKTALSAATQPKKQ